VGIEGADVTVVGSLSGGQPGNWQSRSQDVTGPPSSSVAIAVRREAAGDAAALADRLPVAAAVAGSDQPGVLGQVAARK
jgi:NaMN:DMB phosphoribosyltransferase